MPPAKTRLPAIEGWFTLDEHSPPCLEAGAPRAGTLRFPRRPSSAATRRCQGTEFAETELSRVGKIWSYTDACYQPPRPYEAADPYVPFALAAVELAAEQMVVMGQVVCPGWAWTTSRVGAEVELVLDTLYEDDDHEYLVWKWQPRVGSDGARTGDGEQSRA